MVEYHSVIWDLQYLDVYTQALRFQHNLYWARPPQSLFLTWRDEKVSEEIHWWSWFIDYWMEGGLMRDIITHQVTTQEHWNMLTDRFSTLSLEEKSYANIVGDATVTPTYDPNCVYKMTDGCAPQVIISAERLVSPSAFSYEMQKIGSSIANKPGISDYVSPPEDWDCIWKQVVLNKRGIRTYLERGGDEVEYNFSAEMLTLMISETTRLINKYSTVSSTIASNLVFYLNEYLTQLQQELSEVQSGARKLTDNDFLGPETRRKIYLEQHGSTNGKSHVLKPRYLVRGTERNLLANQQDIDYTEYFKQLDLLLKERRKDLQMETILDEEKRRLQAERE